MGPRTAQRRKDALRVAGNPLWHRGQGIHPRETRLRKGQAEIRHCLKARVSPLVIQGVARKVRASLGGPALYLWRDLGCSPGPTGLSFPIHQMEAPPG